MVKYIKIADRISLKESLLHSDIPIDTGKPLGISLTKVDRRAIKSFRKFRKLIESSKKS